MPDRPPLEKRFAPAPPSPPDSPFDGVLLVDKPAGMTSHDVVAAIRRKFEIRKVGHGGTLDPAATGLLVILLGRGTRLSEALMAGDKVYRGTLRLGVATDSYDADGRVTARSGAWRNLSREQVEAALRAFEGDLFQTPPMVSAVKVNGVPLYKLARKGKTVERKPRLVHVYAFRALAWEPPDIPFEVRCTKGTYVRTLCHEAGENLGCGAHLAALRRLRSGDLSLADALPLDTLLALPRSELPARILPCKHFLTP